MSHVEAFTLTGNLEPAEMPPQTTFHLDLLFAKVAFYGVSIYKRFSSYAEIKTLSDNEQECPHTPNTRGIMRHKSTCLEVIKLEYSLKLKIKRK